MWPVLRSATVPVASATALKITFYISKDSLRVYFLSQSQSKIFKAQTTPSNRILSLSNSILNHNTLLIPLLHFERFECFGEHPGDGQEWGHPGLDCRSPLENLNELSDTYQEVQLI